MRSTGVPALAVYWRPSGAQLALYWRARSQVPQVFVLGRSFSLQRGLCALLNGCAGLLRSAPYAVHHGITNVAISERVQSHGFTASLAGDFGAQGSSARRLVVWSIVHFVLARILAHVSSALAVLPSLLAAAPCQSILVGPGRFEGAGPEVLPLGPLQPGRTLRDRNHDSPPSLCSLASRNDE